MLGGTLGLRRGRESVFELGSRGLVGGLRGRL
jgi:hypothetical protein